MYKQANDFNEEIRHEVRGGTGDVSFQHIYARLVLEEGCSIGYHVHENEAEIYYILSGTAETDDNGVKRILKPGDSTMTRSGEGHSIKALGPGKLEFIATIVSC